MFFARRGKTKIGSSVGYVPVAFHICTTEIERLNALQGRRRPTPAFWKQWKTAALVLMRGPCALPLPTVPMRDGMKMGERKRERKTTTETDEEATIWPVGQDTGKKNRTSLILQKRTFKGQMRGGKCSHLVLIVRTMGTYDLHTDCQKASRRA